MITSTRCERGPPGRGSLESDSWLRSNSSISAPALHSRALTVLLQKLGVCSFLLHRCRWLISDRIADNQPHCVFRALDLFRTSLSVCVARSVYCTLHVMYTSTVLQWGRSGQRTPYLTLGTRHSSVSLQILLFTQCTYFNKYTRAMKALGRREANL